LLRSAAARREKQVISLRELVMDSPPYTSLNASTCSRVMLGCRIGDKIVKHCARVRASTATVFDPTILHHRSL
ncbi:MAG: hypothetical protein ACR2H5_26045, partial [Ktedonobacteraceae bacterium]